VYINSVWYTWNNKKQNPNTYLDHSQWKVINTSYHAYFCLSDNMWRYLESVKPPQKHKTSEEKATYLYWNSLWFPIENLGCPSRVLVIKMNLLVSENYLSHFPTKLLILGIMIKINGLVLASRNGSRVGHGWRIPIMEWYVRYVRKMAIPQQICLTCPQHFVEFFKIFRIQHF
jgi:hypothetical protein